MFSVVCAVLSLSLIFAPASVGKAGLLDFSVKQEKELGEKFNILVRSQMPVIEDPEIVDYVVGLVKRLSGHLASQPPFPITVTVVRNNSINAFAAPAGYIYVFTGLILNLDHESEVAGVLAHELSHITQRHIAKMIEQMQMISLATVLGMVAGLLVGTVGKSGQAGGAMIMGSQAAGATAMLKYSRDSEQEADQVGMNVLEQSGFRVQGMPQAFEILRRMRWLKGYGSIPGYLSTHPDIEERTGYLNSRIGLMPASVRNRPEHDEEFFRIQTIIRARYVDTQQSLDYYTKRETEGKMSCLDQLGLAMTLGRTNQIAKAKQEFEKALACNGSDPLWLREAGCFYLKIKEFRLAEDYLQKALSRKPDDIFTLFYLAKLQAANKNYSVAISYMNRVMIKLPDDAEVRQAYGQILGESGDLFHAYLNLAYAGIYGIDPRLSKTNFDKAKSLARTEEQKKELERLDKIMKERMEFREKYKF